MCGGNTCRSPLAAALLRAAAAARGVAVEVASAGTDAFEGMPASPHAVAAARELGAEIGPHRARRLSREMVAAADLVLTMTRRQRQAVADLVPSAADRVLTLKEFAFGGAKQWGDVDDPFGRPLEAYRRLAADLRAAVEAALDRLAGEDGGG